jgi:hypothetical protein
MYFLYRGKTKSQKESISKDVVSVPNRWLSRLHDVDVYIFSPVREAKRCWLLYTLPPIILKPLFYANEICLCISHDFLW